jgi:hypothetical protein
MSTIDQIASTPGFNAGSVDVQPSNTKVTKITKKIDNLQPGVTYTLLVRAKKNGQFSDYVSYQYTVPETDKSGNNFTISNSNTDIQLLGGGFAASSESEPFPINIGKIDITQNTIAGSGTGVIINQYGIAGFKKGDKQFSLSAIDGDAYFGGTLTAATGTFSGSLSAATGTFAGTVSASAVISGSATFGSTTVTGAISSISTAQSTANSAQSTAGSAYSLAATKLTKSANTITDVNNNMTAIKADGITVYSGTNPSSGARVLMNNQGLVGFDSTSTDNSTGITFSVLSSDGSATFKGAIKSGSTITGASFQTGTGSIYTKIEPSSFNGGLQFYKSNTNGGYFYDNDNFDNTLVIQGHYDNGQTDNVVELWIKKAKSGQKGYVALSRSAGTDQTGLRNITILNTSGLPTGGSDGDIVFTWV